MRVVANGAVFSRLMLADKWATFFHMAGEAGVGNAVALHEFWAGRAMRSVAVGAADLAFKNRVV